MIELAYLPSSLGKTLNALEVSDEFKRYTFTGFINERTLFTDIDRKLNKLENSTDFELIDIEELVKLSEQIELASEEKEISLIRIDWLQRLHKAKGELCSADTKEKLKHLRHIIAPVQTCPLKNQLLDEIEFRETAMSEEAISKEHDEFKLLMDCAIKELGDVFINLGKSGREYVITEVQKQQEDGANTVHVKDCVERVVQKVHALLNLTDRVKLIAELDQLPIPIFSNLVVGRKERIADTLIQEKGWSGLVSLERRIAQINNDIDREERENYERKNVIVLPEGKVAATIDLRFHSID
ncbi:hypothetical protein [Brevibacillus sp. AY1]|uniref:hypothetical protein n=1 Tax=Brevibacillus sp. AY1 TaxID=2807621 RepID=UPI0024576F94|nr:hypothetical protein [Brevibacillus sp. AY1]MDH4620183.1 hypothetical protein [Brevibacillus sp. AY1]